MKFDVLTLFPEAMEGYLSCSIIGKARENGILDIGLVQIRDFSLDKHKKVDDAPFGGGAGMVMTVQPLRDALLSVRTEETHVVLMSPRGKLFSYEKAQELARMPHVVLVCGRYEGIDQRFIDGYVDEEISIGDYVLTGGEAAALVVIDAVSRQCDGVLGNADSLSFESHKENLLEYPQYTRPEVFEGAAVPDILLSGHHANIEKWRREQSLAITKERRPDLLK